MEEINRTPAILLTRTIDKDHCIRFQSKYYFPVTENGDRRYFARKTDFMVIESFDRQFLANIADKLYLMEEVPKHELVSKEFDAPKEAPKKEKKKYIPPMNHPWRKDSFANYAAKQKHRCGNVIKLRIDSYQGIQTKCMPFLFSLAQFKKIVATRSLNLV